MLLPYEERKKIAHDEAHDFINGMNKRSPQKVTCDCSKFEYTE